jgi:hypothetical protein
LTANPQHAGVRNFLLTQYYISVITTANALRSKFDQHNSWQDYASNADTFMQLW